MRSLPLRRSTDFTSRCRATGRSSTGTSFPGSSVLMALCLGASATASATDLEVTHWWTSGGEARAVKVLADAFNEGGDNWIDSAIAGSGSTATPIIVSRILGGEPMGATQLNHGRDAQELVEEGVMLDLTELADAEGWRELIRPAKLLDACTLDGRIYCVPLNIHSFQWMWTSLTAYEEAGVAPPENWEEFVASADQLRQAGKAPLAIGNQAWQTNGMFSVLTAALGGIDLWRAVNIERDMDVVRGADMLAVWQAFADARQLADPENSVQNWNDATNQVIQGQAGAQVMGDWAQGEFAVAGQSAGVEYDCLPGLGMATILDTGGDAFYFPQNDDDEITAAQKRMASLLISKDVQVSFNLAKGSLPVRGDVDLAEANDCMKKGLEILTDESNIIPSQDIVLSPDTVGQLEDLTTEFWSDTSMTAEMAQETYADIVESAD